jgi:hypothetical protein
MDIGVCIRVRIDGSAQTKIALAKMLQAVPRL